MARLRQELLFCLVAVVVCFNLQSCQDKQDPIEREGEFVKKSESLRAWTDSDSLVLDHNRDTIESNFKIIRQGLQYLIQDPEVASAVHDYFEPHVNDTSVRFSMKLTSLDSALEAQGYDLIDKATTSLEDLGYQGEELNNKVSHFESVYDSFQVAHDEQTFVIEPEIWIPFYSNVNFDSTGNWDGKQVREIAVNSYFWVEQGEAFRYQDGNFSKHYYPFPSDSPWGEYFSKIKWIIEGGVYDIDDNDDKLVPFRPFGACVCDYSICPSGQGCSPLCVLGSARFNQCGGGFPCEGDCPLAATESGTAHL